jgi:hypothetical protein
MICRLFIMSSHDLWLKGFREKLQVMDWQIQFAINLDEFKIRFVESETDILILRGIDDQATFEHLQTIFGVRPNCGFIWIYPGGERFSSPYFCMADHRVPLETSDIELIAMTQSLFKLLKRCGWR